jgi:hypothetical protein
MKRIVSILVFITFFITSSAQSNWCQPGAYWEYSLGGQINWATMSQYLNDTIIENKPCQIIQNKSRIIFEGPFSPHAGPEYVGQNSYLHYSGDSLFYYFNNTFNLLFDFGASVGDSWIVSNYSYFDSVYVCDTETITVDSVGVEQFSSQAYRWINIHSDSGSFNGKVFEHIGCINRLFYPDHGACNGQEEPYLNHMCYSDSLFGKLNSMNINDGYTYSENPTFNCGIYTLNVPENIDVNPPVLFPNPATNKIAYEFNKVVATNYMIYSIDGILVQSGIINRNKGEIQLNILSPGLYLIMWNSSNQLCSSKLVIEN